MMTHIRWFGLAIVIVLLALVVLQFLEKPQTPLAAEYVQNDAAAALIDELPSSAPQAAPTPTALPQIAVDVIGAVQQPGVVWLAPGARMNDAIMAAGSLAPDADREAINLAAVVTDGQQVRVPHLGEAASSEAAPPAATTGGATNGKVNINTADAAALEALDGVGPATAAAIISYRTQQGEFREIGEIEDVNGIGPSLFAKIRDQITVGP